MDYHFSQNIKNIKTILKINYLLKVYVEYHLSSRKYEEIYTTTVSKGEQQKQSFLHCAVNSEVCSRRCRPDAPVA